MGVDSEFSLSVDFEDVFFLASLPKIWTYVYAVSIVYSDLTRLATYVKLPSFHILAGLFACDDDY